MGGEDIFNFIKIFKLKRSGHRMRPINEQIMTQWDPPLPRSKGRQNKDEHVLNIRNWKRLIHDWKIKHT